MRHKASAILAFGSVRVSISCGHSSRVEPERATLEIRVRFPVTAPARGSPAVHRKRCRRGICSASSLCSSDRKACLISAAAAVRLCPQRPLRSVPKAGSAALNRWDDGFESLLRNQITRRQVRYRGARRLVTTPVSHTGSGEFDPLAPHHGFDSRAATRANAGASCGRPVGLLRSMSVVVSDTRIQTLGWCPAVLAENRDLEDVGSIPISPDQLWGCSSVVEHQIVNLTSAKLVGGGHSPLRKKRSRGRPAIEALCPQRHGRPRRPRDAPA